jgi:hypothetical protein
MNSFRPLVYLPDGANATSVFCRDSGLFQVGFIARLRPGRFPGSGARKLPSSTNNLLGWVLPPLVICAVEAHPVTPFTWTLA